MPLAVSGYVAPPLSTLLDAEESPRPRTVTAPVYGKAKDLVPTYAATLRTGAVLGTRNNAGSGLQVGIVGKVPLNKSTTVQVGASSGWYRGKQSGNEVQGSIVRGNASITQTRPMGRGAVTAGFAIGVDVDSRLGSGSTTSFDASATVSITQSLNKAVSISAEAAEKFVVFSNGVAQSRPSVAARVKVNEPGSPWTFTGSVSAEARVRSDNNRVTSLVPTVGVGVEHKASSDVTVQLDARYTLPTGLPASNTRLWNTADPPGWAFGGSVRVEL